MSAASLDHDGITRRAFVGSGISALALHALPTPLRTDGRPNTQRISAVAFDGYAIFDASTLIAVAESVIPGKGKEFVAVWRTRQFEYQWLRTMGGRYADFGQTGADALTVAGKSLGFSLSAADRERLLTAQLTLAPWPDAVTTIRELRAAGLRVALLSNMTEAMLVEGARRAGIRDAFEFVLSTDRVRAAKPSPVAYQMAVDAFGLSRDEIAFVAFAGWDAVGAKWYGYPTVWTNRTTAPAEQLDAVPDIVCATLADAKTFLTKSAP
ncbi:MAG: haloacid dehalogenase type II [Gemmatimonas sp.]